MEFTGYLNSELSSLGIVNKFGNVAGWKSQLYQSPNNEEGEGGDSDNCDRRINEILKPFL